MVVRATAREGVERQHMSGARVHRGDKWRERGMTD